MLAGVSPGTGKTLWLLLRLATGLALAVALFVWVDQRLGWTALLAPWQQFPTPLLPAILALLFAGHLLRAWRFHRLMGRETRGSLAEFTAINIWHTTAINWLPMRLGEALFPWLMHRLYGHCPWQSGGSLLWIRLLDLYALLWLSAMTWSIHRAPAWIPALLATLLLLPLAWWVHSQIERGLARHGTGWRYRLRLLLRGFPQQGSTYAQLTLATLLAWAVKLAAFLLAAMAIGPLSLPELLPGVMLAELASSLPIQGLAGFGTYEAAMLLGLSWSHQTARNDATIDLLLAVAVNLHLFILAASLLFSLLALLWFRWLRRVQPAARQKSTE